MVKQPLFIYLAGNIRKGREDRSEVWEEAHKSFLQDAVSSYELVFLDPSHRADNLSSQSTVFGRDLFQVSSADLVLVDARDKRGLGVGAEMMYAKMLKTSLVAWLPEDSHYHRKNLYLLGQMVDEWMHPFIWSLCDYIAPTLELMAGWIQNYKPMQSVVKGPRAIQDAMQEYLEEQLDQDEVMRQLVQKHEKLRKKVDEICMLQCI